VRRVRRRRAGRAAGQAVRAERRGVAIVREGGVAVPDVAVPVVVVPAVEGGVAVPDVAVPVVAVPAVEGGVALPDVALPVVAVPAVAGMSDPPVGVAGALAVARAGRGRL
jgi:hypothetical protein